MVDIRTVSEEVLRRRMVGQSWVSEAHGLRPSRVMDCVVR